MIEPVLVLLLVAVALAGMRAAYRNGVTDGYGFAREPENPGYADAGRYLTERMSHRWSSLSPTPQEKVEQ